MYGKSVSKPSKYIFVCVVWPTYTLDFVSSLRKLLYGLCKQTVNNVEIAL